MKTTIYLVSASIALMSMSIPCLAQENATPKVGIKAGLNLSNMYEGEVKKSEMLLGYNVGVFAKVPVTSFVSFQPELYLTTKGSKTTYSTALLDGTASFRLTYIEVPLLCVVNVTPIIDLQFGPYVAYLIDGSVKNKSNVSLFDYEENINTNNYNRIDAGIAIGAGFDLGAISIGVRYNLGLTKVGKTQTIGGNEYTVPNSCNNVVNAYIALALN